MIRYSVITTKNKREIVMLRGRGCVWKRCRFCDYHLDCSDDVVANYQLNKEQLDQVTGIYGTLEIINSGSFVDLDDQTLQLIEAVCTAKQITQLHFECHWLHRRHIAPLKERFGAKGITVKVKIGVETFDYYYREDNLQKGIPVQDPAEIAADFDECCLLFGLAEQNFDSMINDINTGLTFFDRVCINIMQENSTAVKPDRQVIRTFIDDIYPLYINDDRVDILLENTDFGVGGNH